MTVDHALARAALSSRLRRLYSLITAFAAPQTRRTPAIICARAWALSVDVTSLVTPIRSHRGLSIAVDVFLRYVVLQE